MNFFRPNISRAGRLARAIAGLILAAAAVGLWPHSPLISVLCGVGALFLFFEAARGWCAARACGLKTPL